MSNADHLSAIRDSISPLIVEAQQLVTDRPSNGAEITIAMRKLQEARMWFGVAEALDKGLDPWTAQVSNDPRLKEKDGTTQA